MPWALDDLETIVERLDVETFVRRVEDADMRTMTWIVADWMARERSSEAWATVRQRLGQRPPRPLYARALRELIERHPSSALTPALARVASDSRLRRGWALLASALGVGIEALGGSSRSR